MFNNGRGGGDAPGIQGARQVVLSVGPLSDLVEAQPCTGCCFVGPGDPSTCAPMYFSLVITIFPVDLFPLFNCKI